MILLLFVLVWWEHLGSPAEPGAPVYLALDLSGAGDLHFPCPAQTRLEESIVQTAN